MERDHIAVNAIQIIPTPMQPHLWLYPFNIYALLVV